MGLQAVYERFLARPAADMLDENATLQYVTTLKGFSGQGAVMKHLEDHNKNLVKKKSEKIISAVEGLTSVAIIAETVLEFLSSGGSYLPGVDSFILDRTATLPVTHFVHFDQEQRITQICLSWDQADLLKQVEVIGTRAKNWPVFAGVDQIKMITASQKSHDQVNPAGQLTPRGRSRGGAERSASPSKKHIRDPHASLNLYHQEEDVRQPTAPNAVGPRESHKPAPRDMSDLFAAGHEDYEGTGPNSPPKKVGKDSVIAPKGAGHKKFQPSRIFEEEDLPVKKERQIYKTNPARYNHFDIGDSFDDAFQHRPNNEKRPEDMPIRPKGGNVGFQHKSNWDFEDFNTPEKVKPKVLDHNKVNFDYAEPERGQENVPIRSQSQARKDQESHFDFNDSGTPVTRPVVHKPRKDADNHFEFNDNPTPAPQRRIIARTKAAAGIYSDPVFGQETEPERPLASKSRNTRKEFESSWDF